MTKKFEKLEVSAETLETFVLCLALGTLEAMKSRIWPAEAGVWTIGRPDFLGRLETLPVAEETLNLLAQFDELAALEKMVDEDEFEKELLKIEHAIKRRLEDFPGAFWKARW